MQYNKILLDSRGFRDGSCPHILQELELAAVRDRGAVLLLVRGRGFENYGPEGWKWHAFVFAGSIRLELTRDSEPEADLAVSYGPDQGGFRPCGRACTEIHGVPQGEGLASLPYLVVLALDAHAQGLMARLSAELSGE